jgi:hypothetical protein
VAGAGILGLAAPLVIAAGVLVVVGVVIWVVLNQTSHAAPPAAGPTLQASAKASGPGASGPKGEFAGEWAPVGSRYQVVQTGAGAYEIRVSPGDYDTERYLCAESVKSIEVKGSGSHFEGTRRFAYYNAATHQCTDLGEGTITIDVAPDGKTAQVTHQGPVMPDCTAGPDAGERACNADLVEPWTRIG